MLQVIQPTDFNQLDFNIDKQIKISPDDGADKGFQGVSALTALENMRIVDNQYPYYDGLYRYLTASGGINWYFLFLTIFESKGK